jgi:hypothetical protein
MLFMKKFLIVGLAAALAVAFSGCKGQAPAQSGASGAQSGAAASSQQGTASSGAASSKPKPIPIKPSAKSKISVKETDYKFVKGQKNLRAEYPQASGSGKDYSKVNALLKSTALQTINSAGTDPSKFAEIKVTSHVAYKDENFLSVTFQENYKSAKGAKAKRSFRTVNYDLKAGKALSVDDMVQKNGALLKALQNAVQSQMSKKKAASFPASVIQAGMRSASVYFKDNGTVGFSLPVSQQLGDHVELSVKLKDTAGFRTGNSAWSYFTK